ncbi:MAG: serine hydrolase domain-containing protein, partial [Bacillota bacterium]|nr:serine hydrolase domain-containing protein [Bacillota bacterium]
MIKDKAALSRVCENFISTTMDFYDIPGLAVGVYCGEEFIFTGAGGFRNYETKDALAAETVFHCTSVSKLFTAAGVIKLATDGKLSLGDKLCELVPWLSIADKRWTEITVESMLSHTSGFTDVNDYNWKEHKIGADALKEYALSGEVSGRNLLWEPACAGNAGKFRYSSLAYNLLGLVIAEVSGMEYEEFMRREIFEPLGMTDSTFLTSDRVEGDLSLDAINRCGMAMPHSKGRDRTISLVDVYPYSRQHAPSSTLTSTAGDLLKWAQACMDGAVDTVMDEMWRPRVEVPDTGEKMGLGWFIREQNGYKLMGHEGSDDGFRTSFWLCPEIKVAVVLLSNITDAPLKKLSKKLFEML